MARTFSGTGQRLSRTTSVPATGTPCTMACWFQRADTSGVETLMALAASGGTDYLRLDATASLTVQASALDEFGSASATSSAATSVDTWTHAAAVYSGQASRAAFLNGANKGTNTTDVLPVGITEVHLAAFLTTQLLNGRLAEAGIWVAALTDDEVAELAAGMSPLLVRPNSLRFYWRGLDADGDIDWWNQHNLSVTGSPTYAQHPPIIYPRGVRVHIPAPAGGGGGGTVIPVMMNQYRQRWN